MVTQSLYDGAVEAHLDNGLRVLVETAPQSRAASVALWCNVGSRDDPEMHPGSAHFIEHLAFRGTAQRTAREISRTIDSVGGHLDAATSREATFYYADVPGDGCAVAQDLLFDLALRPQFPQEGIEIERSVVLEEIRGHNEDPEARAYDLFASTVWPQHHPLSHPILGSVDAIRTLTREAIIDHHRAFYRPDNLAMVTCGAVDPNAFIDRAAESADRVWGNAALDHETVHHRHAPEVLPGTIHYEQPTQQSHVYVAFPGPSASDPDRFALDVANTVLGDGTSSWLFQTIREERGWAYAIGSGVTRYSDNGMWLAYAAVAPSVASEVCRQIQEAFERLRSAPIPEDDFALAKSRLRGLFILGQESVSSRALRLGTAAMTKREILSPDEVLRRLDAVDQDAVLHSVRRFLDPDRVNATIVGPASDA